jgi:hypothetical protein
MSDGTETASATPPTLASVEAELQQIAAATAASTSTTPQAAFEAAWAKVYPTWLSAFVANSPVSQSTAAWNHLTTTALPALQAALMKELSQ